jgi:hypothetical protein
LRSVRVSCCLYFRVLSTIKNRFALKHGNHATPNFRNKQRSYKYNVNVQLKYALLVEFMHQLVILLLQSGTHIYFNQGDFTVYTTFRPHTALQGPQFAGKNAKRSALLLGLMATGLQGASVSTRNADQAGKDIDTFSANHQKHANQPTLFEMVDDSPAIHVVDTPQDRHARGILTRPPFAPTDFNLFVHETYPQATNLPPAAKKAADEKAVLKTLNAIFKKRFQDDAQKAEEATNFYHNSTLAQIAPDPNLRGAITILQGTLGKDAIKEILKDVERIEFGPMPPDKANAIALSLPSDPGAKKPTKFLFNEDYQGEDFRLLASTILHENFHKRDANSIPEDRIASYGETLTHGGLVAEDPDLSQKGTKLSQRLNSKLMALLNTRDGEPGSGNVHISGPNRNVFPGGGRELDNFGAFFNDPGTEIAGTDIQPTSDGNTLLDNVVSLSTNQTEHGLRFDEETENKLNATQKVMSPTQLLQAIKALKLDIGPEEQPEPPKSSSTTSATLPEQSNHTSGQAPEPSASTSNASRRHKNWFLP